MKALPPTWAHTYPIKLSNLKFLCKRLSSSFDFEKTWDLPKIYFNYLLFVFVIGRFTDQKAMQSVIPNIKTCDVNIFEITFL